MVASIQDQVHEHLIQLEEERCRQLEAENRDKGVTREVKRREIPKPSVRPGDDGLCLGEFLEVITAYDYDLSDEDFQAYCQRRGTLHVAGQGNPFAASRPSQARERARGDEQDPNRHTSGVGRPSRGRVVAALPLTRRGPGWGAVPQDRQTRS
jgi:hypothetical protein